MVFDHAARKVLDGRLSRPATRYHPARALEPRRPSAVHLPVIEASPEVNSLIWLVGAIVIVLAILSLLGLR